MLGNITYQAYLSVNTAEHTYTRQKATALNVASIYCINRQNSVEQG